MSDLSLPCCEKCRQPEYACQCDSGLCCDCGKPLSREEESVHRDMCETLRSAKSNRP